MYWNQWYYNYLRNLIAYLTVTDNFGVHAKHVNLVHIYCMVICLPRPGEQNVTKISLSPSGETPREPSPISWFSKSWVNLAPKGGKEERLGQLVAMSLHDCEGKILKKPLWFNYGACIVSTVYYQAHYTGHYGSYWWTEVLCLENFLA